MSLQINGHFHNLSNFFREHARGARAIFHLCKISIYTNYISIQASVFLIISHFLFVSWLSSTVWTAWCCTVSDWTSRRRLSRSSPHSIQTQSRSTLCYRSHTVHHTGVLVLPHNYHSDHHTPGTHHLLAVKTLHLSDRWWWWWQSGGCWLWGPWLLLSHSDRSDY